MKYTIIEGDRRFVVETIGTPDKDVFVTLETPEISQTHYAGWVLHDAGEWIAMKERYIDGDIKQIALSRMPDEMQAMRVVAKAFIRENPDLFSAEEVTR